MEGIDGVHWVGHVHGVDTMVFTSIFYFAMTRRTVITTHMTASKITAPLI
jgi:hypothetical protein